MKRCYLADFGRLENGKPMTPCHGWPVKCHLIPARMLKRLGHDPADPRSWVWGCGGIVGLGGHHGMLDSSKRLRLSRAAIPRETEELARELEIEWFLDSEYGRFTGVCPIREHTADGAFVGRCDSSTYDDVCPRHGMLSDYPDKDDRAVNPQDRRFC